MGAYGGEYTPAEEDLYYFNTHFSYEEFDRAIARIKAAAWDVGVKAAYLYCEDVSNNPYKVD